MLRNSNRALGWLVIGLAVLALTAQSQGEQGAGAPSEFEQLGGATRELRFARGGKDVPAGGHFQGIQLKFDASAHRHLAFLSHDSLTVAYLVVAEFSESFDRPGHVLTVHEFPSDGQSPALRHAGGIQLCGDILAVGLEDNQQKTRSQVQFWNVADPVKPTHLAHLTVKREGAPKEKTAGAVGLIKRERDHLLAVANWDSRDVDFYLSNGRPLVDAGCRFEPAQHWSAKSAATGQWRPDDRFGAYQAVHLATAGKRMFLIGFETRMPGGDVADLFEVDLAAGPPRLLTKLASKSVRLTGGCHFQAAGGLWATEAGWAMLAAPHAFTPEAILNLVR
jgi:hypothetical protein